MSIKFIDNSAAVLGALERATERGLEAVGLAAEGYAKRKITSYPAVVTGRLRDSITHVVKSNEQAVYIGTNVEYAPYVELGTVKMPARPFLKPAATEHSEEYKLLMRNSLENA